MQGFETPRHELFVVGLEGEGWEAHHAVPVVTAGAAVGIQALVGVLDGDVRHGGVDLVPNAPEQLPVRGLVGPLAPRVEHDPDACVHGHVEVGVGDVGVHVLGVVHGFRFAEGTAARLRGGTRVPVVVVISVEVHLIDVPPRVDVVPVWIEHDEDVQLGVLQHIDGFLVPCLPLVDVEFRGEVGQRRAEVFVAVMSAVDVDDFLRGSIRFGVHRPVGKAHHPKGPSKLGLSDVHQVHDVRVVVGPAVDLQGQRRPRHVHVVVDGLAWPRFFSDDLGPLRLNRSSRQRCEEHHDEQQGTAAHGTPTGLGLMTLPTLTSQK